MSDIPIDKDREPPSEDANFAIEKSVPFPVGYGKQKYPFLDMEVGDSFFFRDHVESVRSLTQRQHRDGTRLKFITRTENDGWRCWRVK